MKRVSIIIITILITPLFALFGVGANVNIDKVSYDSYTSSTTDESTSLTYNVMGDSFSNAGGLSFYMYFDFIPVIDLEANVELVGNSYKFKTNLVNSLGDTEELAIGDYPWGRISTYLTVRKKLTGVKVPFLAKAQIYAGGGINSHSVSPRLDVDFFTNAFNTSDINSALNQDFSSTEVMDTLVDYVGKKSTQHSGIHLQVGSQVKVLFMNLFMNGRYTFAKDVIPGTNGFASMNLGLAMGL